MAPHYDQIGEYGLNQLVARRLTTPGGSVAPTVAPELFPILTLENDRPEWGYIKGENPRSSRIFVAAVAGNYNTAQFYIPTDRPALAVIQRILSHNSALLEVGRSFIGAGLAGWTAANTAARDMRDGSNGGLVHAERTTTVGVPASFANLGALLNDSQEFQNPIILAPSGSAVLITTAATNVNLDITVHWYERAAQPGEL